MDNCYIAFRVHSTTVRNSGIFLMNKNIELRWTDDGGHNYSNPQIGSSGDIGQTTQRVMWRRIGSTRRNSGLDRVFEVSSADPVQVALIGASLNDG